jgi:gamma-glutamylcyclotransferase (GGCT)/AIG2-like uncharacterized protein YtfP
MRLFFYGTLLDGDVQSLVLGRRLTESELRPALLRHVRRVYVAGHPYPMLLPHRGGGVEGAVADRLSRDDLARIQRYEGDAYRLERHMVCLIGADGRPSAEPVSAWLFRGAPAMRPSTREWRLAAWQARDKAAYLRDIRESGIADRSAR